VSRALHADKLGYVFEILTKNVLPFPREHRHRADAKLEKLVAPCGIIDNIDGGKEDLFFRKKLFRSETAASTRLRE